MSYVYGLCAEHGVKIGRSSDPDDRRRTLQTGSVVRLVPMFTIACGNDRVSMALERLIHEWLADERIRGEWFMGPKVVWLAGWLQRGLSREDAAQIVAEIGLSNQWSPETPC